MVHSFKKQKCLAKSLAIEQQWADSMTVSLTIKN